MAALKTLRSGSGRSPADVVAGQLAAAQRQLPPLRMGPARVARLAPTGRRLR